MSDRIVTLPFEQFLDPVNGSPLFDAKIYIGQVDTDPTVPANQLQVFYVQEDGSKVNIPQPVRTNTAGFTINNQGDVIQIRVDSNYSMRVFEGFTDAEVTQYNIPDNSESATASVGYVTENFTGKASSIKDLINFTPFDDGDIVYVASYHDGWAATNKLPEGGGAFVWNSSRLKSEHNGVTVIDPLAPFPALWGDTGQQAAWFDSSNSGSGCWILLIVNNTITASQSGSVGGFTEYDNTPIMALFNAAKHHSVRTVILNDDYLLDSSNNTPGLYSSILVVDGLKRTKLTGGGSLKIRGDTDRTPASIIYLKRCFGLQIERLTFDGNTDNRVPTSSYTSSDNLITVADGCKKISIKNNNLINSIGFGILVYNKELNTTLKISNINIVGNYATNNGQTSYCVINCIDGSIDRNQSGPGNGVGLFSGGGIQLESAENQGFEFAPIKITVTNNKCHGGITLFNSVKDVKVHNNTCSKITLRENLREVIVSDNTCSEIEYGSFTDVNGYKQDITVTNNTVNGPVYSEQRAIGPRFKRNKIKDSDGPGFSETINSDVTFCDNEIIDCCRSEEGPALRLWSQYTAKGNKIRKTTTDSKQYVADFGSGVGSRIFIDNESEGDNTNQSGSVYTLLGANQTPDFARLPSLAGRNDVGDPLLDFGVSADRGPFPLEWVTSVDGGGEITLNADMVRMGTPKLFRQVGNNDFFINGSFTDGVNQYTSIRIREDQSVVSVLNINGVLYVDKKIGYVDLV